MKQLELFEKNIIGDTEKIALEDVFSAYYECRCAKRRTVNALSFELDFEKELIKLWREINSGAYKIGRSIAFIVKHPVQREVFAADFRDRVIHHLVIAKINHLFEQEFIVNSYSCRVGKGTLFGVNCIKTMIETCSAMYTRDCYILKLDIQSFFMTINKTILYQMLISFLEEKYYQPDKRILFRLIKQIIFNQPEENCIVKGRRSDWNGLPCYKSLFWAEGNCGLPIGNLTSQIFANFYLNKLDQYVTKDLGFAYYGRYVDDFILIHQDKRVLLDAKKKIEVFLAKELKLKLHPHKVYLQHYSKGVQFIGAVIKPNRIYIGKRTKHNLYHRIYKMLPQMAESVENTFEYLEYFVASVNSYFGFMRHYNTYNLRSHILSFLDKTFLSEILEMVPHAEKLSINKMFRPLSQIKRKLCRQKRYRYYQKKKGSKNGNV